MGGDPPLFSNLIFEDIEPPALPPAQSFTELNLHHLPLEPRTDVLTALPSIPLQVSAENLEQAHQFDDFQPPAILGRSLPNELAGKLRIFSLEEYS
jgi:hypothetical protein